MFSRWWWEACGRCGQVKVEGEVSFVALLALSPRQHPPMASRRTVPILLDLGVKWSYEHCLASVSGVSREALVKFGDGSRSLPLPKSLLEL